MGAKHTGEELIVAAAKETVRVVIGGQTTQ